MSVNNSNQWKCNFSTDFYGINQLRRLACSADSFKISPLLFGSHCNHNKSIPTSLKKKTFNCVSTEFIDQILCRSDCPEKAANLTRICSGKMSGARRVDLPPASSTPSTSSKSSSARPTSGNSASGPSDRVSVFSRLGTKSSSKSSGSSTQGINKTHSK